VRRRIAPTAYRDLLERAASTDETSLTSALNLLHGDALVFVLAGDLGQLRPQLETAGLKVTVVSNVRSNVEIPDSR
jgi:hypothetical protein